jgi:serine/threonine protein phosphatase 1
MKTTIHRRIVIGDVHGHYNALMTLLEAIAPSSQDEVYFLGDLIDRGPQSFQVVDFVQASPFYCLLGNHEQLLLDSFGSQENHQAIMQVWLYSGGHSTIASYRQEGTSILSEHIEWMRTLPTYLDLGDFWLVHAGIDPKIPLAEQTSDQFCWVRDQFHSITKPYFPDKLIITGHTITFTLPNVPPGKIAQGQGWLDIDTGAYHRKSGWLTALDLTNSLVYQVNVFEETIRTLPLEKAIAKVEPALVLPRN